MQEANERKEPRGSQASIRQGVEAGVPQCQVTSDVGLLTCRELGRALGLVKAGKDRSLHSLQLKLSKLDGRVVSKSLDVQVRVHALRGSGQA